jgi:hypothetical protein
MFDRLDSLPLPLRLALDPVIGGFLLLCLLGIIIRIIPPLYWIVRVIGRPLKIVFSLAVLFLPILWKWFIHKLTTMRPVRKRKHIRSFNSLCTRYIEMINDDAEKIVSFAQVCHTAETLLVRTPIRSRGIHRALVVMAYDHLIQLWRALKLPQGTTEVGLRVLERRRHEDLERSRVQDY